MKKHFTLLFFSLLAVFSSNAQDWVETFKTKSPKAGVAQLYGMSAEIHNQFAIIGAPSDTKESDASIICGSAFIMELKNGVWENTQTLQGSDTQEKAEFGHSVYINDNYAVVGAIRAKNAQNKSTGLAYVFKNTNGVWEEVSVLSPPDGEYLDEFGWSVAISGYYIIVGAINNDKQTDERFKGKGAAYIYKNNNGNWEYLQKLTAYDKDFEDNYGRAVDIFGDYAIVGCAREDLDENGQNLLDNAGATYVYYNNNGTWEFKQKLVPSNRVESASFGFSVAIKSDKIIIGAQNEEIDYPAPTLSTAFGCAYIFENIAGGWQEVSRIHPGSLTDGELFGSAVDIDGNYAIVGASSDDEDENGENELTEAGSVYMLKKINGTWQITEKIVNADRDATDSFGWDVSISKSKAVVGTPMENTYENNHPIEKFGSAYYFSASPIINNELQNHTNICIDSEIELEVTASNTTGYQWQISTNNGTDFTHITDAAVYSGIQTSKLSFNAKSQLNNYQYRCLVYNSIDTTFSNTATITIDNTAPSITSTHSDISINAVNNCSALLPDYTSNLIASDNCDASLTITQEPAAGTSISGATNKVILTATDDAGNASEVSFNVEVIDNTAPSITSTHSDVSINAVNNCSALLPDYTSNLITSDNCDASLTITQEPAPGTSISGATNEVILTATDDAGNASEVSFNVEVIDNTAPSITSTHSDVSINAVNNCSAILPDYTSNLIASDNCDASLTITQEPASGTSISGATNEVILTATDDAGNAAEVSFNVEVIDNTAPSITSTHNDVSINAMNNCSANLPDYTSNVIASDNCDASLTITQEPASGTSISGATNEVILTATDDAGNAAEVSFNVEVIDNTAPSITSSHSNVSIDADGNNTAILPDYTTDIIANDNCDNNVSVSQSPTAGTSISGATNEVILTVTDNAGNSSEVSFNVEVVDNTAPIISSTLNNTSVDADDNCSATLPDYTIEVTATDNSDADLVITQLPAAGTSISGEVNEIIITVTDNSGNSSQISFNVEVVDMQDPEITCIDDVIVNLNSGQNAYIVNGNELDISASYDNCSVLTITNDFNNTNTLDGASIPFGETVINWTASDEFGNTTNCSFTVTVNQTNSNTNLSQSIFSIQPNPSTDKINIKLELFNNECKITITDLFGKKIIEKQNVINDTNIDISKLLPGTYLVKLITDKQVITKKIIKE